jgi:hypothetical protein
MKRILFFYVCVATLFVACTQELNDAVNKNIDSSNPNLISLTQEEYTSISNDKITEASEEVLYGMIADFMSNGIEEKATRSVSNLKFTIKSKEYIGSKEPTATQSRSGDDAVTLPVYGILVEESDQKSYTIVSADSRALGVMAFFEDVSEDDEEFDYELKNNPNALHMLALAELQLLKEVDDVEKTKAELRDKTIERICAELNISPSQYSFEEIIDKIEVCNMPATRLTGFENYPQSAYVTGKAPMSQIYWTQISPYNDKCEAGKLLMSIPGLSPFLYDGNAKAGCVTIACLMIDACLNQPSIGGYSMDWSFYKGAKELIKGETPTQLFDRATNAIQWISDKLGSNQYKGYLNGEEYFLATYASSSAGFNYVKEFYSCDSERPFDPDYVLTSLNAGSPIYVSGQVWGDDGPGTSYHYEGHAWVIDGYVIVNKNAQMIEHTRSEANTRMSIVQYYDMYWHVNLGWGKSSYAYFKLNSDTSCTIDLLDQFSRNNNINLNATQIIGNIQRY